MSGRWDTYGPAWVMSGKLGGYSPLWVMGKWDGYSRTGRREGVREEEGIHNARTHARARIHTHTHTHTLTNDKKGLKAINDEKIETAGGLEAVLDT